MAWEIQNQHKCIDPVDTVEAQRKVIDYWEGTSTTKFDVIRVWSLIT